MPRRKHKLTLLDRLRGWYWCQQVWLDRDGHYVGTIHYRKDIQ